MRLSWSQHLIASRTVQQVGNQEVGAALALMGMALLIMLQDLDANV